MLRLVAFLRGMNLGRRRLANEDLRAHVEALGFTDVATFRASGNVILTAPARERLADAARRLEAGLTERLAYDVPVFARDAEQMRAIAAFAPFAEDELAASKGKPQVVLLHDAPDAAARSAALALAPTGDRFVFEGAELHWLPCAGLADTTLDLKLLATALGPTTVRTKGTIELIAAKWFAPQSPLQTTPPGTSPRHR
ncbi:MAG: DUF1697 domain-containing protein [Actinobacteria bacterium]|nr:DUF1697 domain-containing protein [Actinomycetota bacterium]